MEKKRLNSNVVSAAQLLSGFAGVLLISAKSAIVEQVATLYKNVKESESALLELIIHLMEQSMHLDVDFVEMALMNQSYQTKILFLICI